VGSQALTQHVDRDERAVRLVLPERPAVARVEPLNMSRDPVDRAGSVGANERSVRTHFCPMASLRALKNGARWQQAALDDPAKGDARLRALGLRDFDGIIACLRNFRDPLARDACVARIALDADEVPRKSLRYRAGRTRAEEWIEDHITRLG